MSEHTSDAGSSSFDGNASRNKIPSDASGALSNVSPATSTFERCCMRLGYLFGKATKRNNVAVALSSIIIFTQLLFVFLPPALYGTGVGLLDFFYLFSVPVFDANFGATHLAWILVAWLLPLVPLAVTITIVFQAVFAAQGKNSPVIISRLAYASAMVFTVLLYPTVRLLASSMLCTSYRGDGVVIGWTDVECSSVTNITLVVYAAIVLPVVLFTAYMYKSLVFSRNPLSKSVLSAPTSQVQELTFVLQTLAVVLVPLLTYDTNGMNSITTLVVCAVVFAFLAVLHCVRLPYYRLTGNLINCGVNGALAMAAVGRLVTDLADISGYNAIIAHYSLVLAGFGCAAIAVAVRYKRIMTQPADKDTAVPASPDKRPHVAFATVAVPSSVYQVELMTRHLLFVPKKSFTSAADWCKEAYGAALDKYPESTLLRALRSMFYLWYMNDPLMSRVEIQKGIRNDESSFDERYLMFCLDFEYAEMRLSDAHGGQMDMITFPEFAKNLKLAQKQHRTAVRVIHAFWKTLLAEKPDINILPALIAKMQKIENTADNLFIKLLSQGSRSQHVLREYAGYLRNVKLNAEQARRFDERADAIERGDYDGKKGKDSSSGGGVSTSDIKNNLDESDLSTQARIRKTMRRAGSGHHSDSSLRRLKTYTIIAFASMFIILIAVLVTALVTFDSMVDNLHQTHAAGKRMELTVTAALNAGHIRVTGAHPWFGQIGIKPLEDANLHKSLAERAQTLWDIHMALLLGTDDIKAATDSLNERINKRANLFVEDFDPPIVSYHNAMTMFVDALQTVATATTADLMLADSGNYSFAYNETFEFMASLVSKYNYASDNGHYALFDAAQDCLNGVVAEADRTSNATTMSVVLSVSGVILFLFVIGVLVFKQSLDDIQFDRNVALNLFLYIPSEVVMKTLESSKKALDEHKETMKFRRKRVKKRAPLVSVEGQQLPNTIPEINEEQVAEEMEEDLECSGSDEESRAVDEEVAQVAQGEIKPAFKDGPPLGLMATRKTPEVSYSDHKSLSLTGRPESRLSKIETKLETEHTLATHQSSVITIESVARMSSISRILLAVICLFVLALVGLPITQSTLLLTVTDNMKDQLDQRELANQFRFNGRELVATAQTFALSGSLSNYLDYFAVVNEDRQRAIISELRRMGMSEDEMKLFNECMQYDSVQADIESSCMRLAAEAMGVDPEVVPDIATYSWDAESAPDYETNKQLMPQQKVWLTNTDKDTALPAHEKLELADGVLFGPAYISKQDSVEEYTRELELMMKERLLKDTDSFSNYIVMVQVGVAFVAVVLCVVTLLFTRGMLSRRRKLLVYYANVQAEETAETAEDTKVTLASVHSVKKYIIGLIVCVVVIALAAFALELTVLLMKSESDDAFSDWYDDKGTFFDMKIMERMLSERARAAALTCNLNYYRQYFEAGTTMGLLERSERFKADTKEEIWTMWNEALIKLTHLEKVGLTLGASVCGFSQEQVPEVYNFNYDHATEADYSREDELFYNRTYKYTNRTYDMSLDADTRKQLARAALVDERYQYYKKDLRNVLEQFVLDIRNIDSARFDNSAANPSNLSIGIAIAIAVLWPVLFVFGALAHSKLSKGEAPFSTQRQDLALIKQNVKLGEISTLTYKFLTGYGLSMVIITAFLISCLFIMLTHTQDQSTLALSHVDVTETVLMTTYAGFSANRPTQRNYFLTFLRNAYNAARASRRELGIRSTESMDFADASDAYTDTMRERLSHEVYKYLESPDKSMKNEYFLGINRVFYEAYPLFVDRVEHTLQGLINKVDEHVTATSILFACMFVILCAVVYVSVVNALSRVAEENERTAIMLWMIPQHVLVTVPEIRGYMQRHSDQKDGYLEMEQTQLEQMRKEYEKVLEQNRLQSQLVNSMLPEHVAKQLAAGKTVKPENYPAVTVLFSDIVGFTNMCSQLDPIKVMDMLNKLFVRFDKLTTEHGLFKVETIGDAYMVVGGIPKQVPDHAQRCAAMALDMLESISDFQIDLDNGTQLPIKIRVGMHSGSVVASVVGDIRCNPRYCLFGDTVNTASRMESTSVPMRVQLTESTAQLIKGDFALEERGSIEVKGKGTMKTYFLSGTLQAASFSHLPSVRALEQIEHSRPNSHKTPTLTSPFAEAKAASLMRN